MTTATAPRVHSGTVKFPPREPRETKFGPRINAVVVLGNGEEIRIWGNPGQEPLASVERDQTVHVLQDGRGNWQLLQPEEWPAGSSLPTGQPAPVPAASPSPAPSSVAQAHQPKPLPSVAEISTTAQALALLLGSCRTLAIDSLPGAPPEAIQAATATVFLALKDVYGYRALAEVFTTEPPEQLRSATDPDEMPF